MAISLSSLKRTIALAPPRILAYGVAGVGKTTFAAGAPNPVFILTEDGLGTLDVPHFPLARSFDEVMAALTDRDRGDLTAAPSHTTARTGPYTAVRRIKRGWLVREGEGGRVRRGRYY